MASLEELEVSQEAMEIGESIWTMVDHWGFFAKDTIGKQLIRSADSIAANISENFGRYFTRKTSSLCTLAGDPFAKPKPGPPRPITRGFCLMICLKC